jgi:DNA-binding NarL/FixJ family response regulator
MDGEGDASSVAGKSLWSIFPDGWMRERAEFGAEVVRSGRPAMVRSVWHGRQVLSWVTPLDTDAPPAEARLLVISRHSHETPVGEENGQPGFMVFDSKYISLGELDILSPRELEVLALVGQGLSIKEIAAMLHRSEKTIQNHRDAIGAKLGLANRVHVAAVARRAGLTPDDAQKTRI